MFQEIRIFLNKIFYILKKPEMEILPGHLAYFFVLSIIPVITLLVFFGSLIHIPSDNLLQFFNEAFPEAISEILVPAFTESTMSFSTFLLLIITFFIASNGVYSIIATSNLLYKVTNFNTIKNRIKSILITIIFLSLILFMIFIPIFGQQVIDIVSNLLHNREIYDHFMSLYNILHLPISILFIYFNIKLIYTISPSKNIQSRDVTKGAIFTTVTWIIVVKIYSYYVVHFSNYDKLYGNLSNLIVLMLFIYILSYIFVIGMALNASKNEIEYELEKTGKIKKNK